MDGYDPKQNNNNSSDSFYAYSYKNEAAKQTPPPIYQETISEPPPNGTSKPKGRGKKIASRLAALALCGAVGFGGGYAALQIAGPANTPAVIYQAPPTNGAPTGTAQGLLDMSDVAEIAGKSVISISTENTMTDIFNRGRIVSGAGSGVILTQDGYIITNHHVINGASNIIVTLPDGTEHNASVVGGDARSDVAILKINTSGLTPAVVANSDNLRVGEFCLAIGNPMGTLGGTVTDGIISALNREINVDGNEMNLLQMSAAVSPGNSGGGLFNANGELVGIVNAKSGGAESEGLGFAIPVNYALQISEDLIDKGYVSGRPALGITARDASPEMGDASEGAYVAEVGAGAAENGLQAGDIIIAANGSLIKTRSALSNAIAELTVGDQINLQVLRNEKIIDINFVLQESEPVIAK